jgi:hypothetical protein
LPIVDGCREGDTLLLADLFSLMTAFITPRRFDIAADYASHFRAAAIAISPLLPIFDTASRCHAFIFAIDEFIDSAIIAISFSPAFASFHIDCAISIAIDDEYASHCRISG